MWTEKTVLLKTVLLDEPLIDCVYPGCGIKANARYKYNGRWTAACMQTHLVANEHWEINGPRKRFTKLTDRCALKPDSAFSAFAFSALMIMCRSLEGHRTLNTMRWQRQKASEGLRGFFFSIDWRMKRGDRFTTEY